MKYPTVTAPPEKFQFMVNTEPAEQFGKHLLAHLKPEQGGFVFEPVRERALEASKGGTDFSGLFLGFSFFLMFRS